MIVKERERTSTRQTPAARSMGSGSNTGPRLAPESNAVWNGKLLTFPVTNKESVLRWGSIQIEGLDVLECELKSDAPGYASLYPGDRVPLPPGGKVNFTLTVNSRRTEPCEFRVYGFKYMTESPQDGGARGLNKECRWMPPPSERDFEIELSPDTTALRPWHRWGFDTPKAEVTVTNFSYMDMNVRPLVYRSEKPGEGRPVSELSSQTTASGMSRTWRVAIKPGKRDRNEDFVLSSEAVISPPEGVAAAFRVPCQDVTYVEYVPFPRRWYDWLLLLGGCGLALFALVWIIWGVPEYAGRAVRIQLHLQTKSASGQVLNIIPADWKEIHIALQSPDETGKPIPSDWSQGGDYQFTLPKRWLGMRWPIGGWNGVATEQRPYQLMVTPSGAFESRYKVEPSEPLRIAYADENRRLYDHGYGLDKRIGVPMMLTAKKGDEKQGVPPVTRRDEGTRPPVPHQDPPKQKDVKTPPRIILPPAVPLHGSSLTPEQKAVDALCARLTLPRRTDNPLAVSLDVNVRDPAKPSELSFELTVPPACYVQLYSFRGGEWHAMLGYRKNMMTDINEPIFGEPNPSEGEQATAWPSEILHDNQPHDDTKANLDIEYILVAVKSDANISAEDQKDMVKFIKGQAVDRSKWAVAGWRGHRDAANLPFRKTTE